MAWAGKGQLASISPRVLTSKIKEAKSPSEIIAIIELHASDFNEIHSATCLYELAKRRHLLSHEDTQSPILFDLIDFMDYQTLQMDPFSLSNSAWSVAHLQPLMGEHVTKVMPSIADQSILTLSKFSPRQLSNLAWAFARLQIRNLQLFEMIAQMVVRKIESCDAQNLSNLALSFAKLGIQNPELMDAIAKQTVSIIGALFQQHLSNLAWGFAKLGIRNAVLMDVIAKRAVIIIGRFEEQQLCNLAWSFATLRIRDAVLMDAIAKRAVDVIDTFPEQGILNLAWGFATLGHSNAALMDAIAMRSMDRIDKFNHKGLGNLASSYWKLGIRNPSLMHCVCTTMKERSIGQQSVGDAAFNWANTIAAAVDDGVVDSEVLTACASFLLQPGHLNKVSPYCISILLRSAERDDWQTKEPLLYQALKAGFKKRRIPRAALDSDLMRDPTRWTESFG